MKKIRILLLLLSALLIVPFYVSAASAASVKNNALAHEKNTMHLVTIAMPDHAVLRKPAQPVLFPLTDATKKFIQTFQTFFYDLKSPLGKPAGLAAPQVGYSLSVIIIQIPPEAKQKRKDVYDTLPPTVLINPTYTPILKAGQSKDWEGCFSVPNKMGEVYRYNEIHYEAYTIAGKKIDSYARGFLARLLQHEIDHLQGRLYIDHACADCRYDSITAVLKIIKAEKNAEKNSSLHRDSE